MLMNRPSVSTSEPFIRINYSSVRYHIANVAFGHIQADPHNDWYLHTI